MIIRKCMYCGKLRIEKFFGYKEISEKELEKLKKRKGETEMGVVWITCPNCELIIKKEIKMKGG